MAGETETKTRKEKIDAVAATLAARLVSILSFDVISFAAGLSRMLFWRFFAVMVLGAAPATFAYAYLGERAPQFGQVLLIAFGVVIAGAVLAAIVRRRRAGVGRDGAEVPKRCCSARARSTARRGRPAPEASGTHREAACDAPVSGHIPHGGNL